MELRGASGHMELLTARSTDGCLSDKLRLRFPSHVHVDPQLPPSASLQLWTLSTLREY